MNNIYSASAIKKKYAVKLVGIEHWSILNRDKLPSYVKKMGIVGYSTVDQLISVSESLRQRILLHFNKDSIVVHNMVDENFFQMPIREYVDRDKLIYISIGSLIYRKGYDILIKALSEVARHSSNWELKIVGGGPEEKNLQNLIMQLGLKNNIKLVGRKINKRLFLCYMIVMFSFFLLVQKIFRLRFWRHYLQDYQWWRRLVGE